MTGRNQGTSEQDESHLEGRRREKKVGEEKRGIAGEFEPQFSEVLQHGPGTPGMRLTIITTLLSGE